MRTKDWLIKNRKNNNLTQEQLAHIIKVSPFTIQQIEQGKRMGSTETWNKIENYFNSNNDDVLISYDDNNLIEEIKQDINEFGVDYPCILIYTTFKQHIIFKDYTLISKDLPFDPSTELNKNEKFLKTSLQYALEVFEAQNKLL